MNSFTMRLALVAVAMIFGIDAQMNFDLLDVDTNGRLSMTEFQSGFPQSTSEMVLKSLMSTFDVDNDEHLSRNEMIELMKSYQQRFGGQSAQKIKLDGLFNNLDLNNDDFISRDEMIKFAQRKSIHLSLFDAQLSAADTDNDNRISLNEFMMLSQNIENQTPKERKTQIAMTMMNLFDSNRDGEIALEEIKTFADKYENIDDEMVKILFSKTDLDNNGFIHFEEMSQSVSNGQAQRQNYEQQISEMRRQKVAKNTLDLIDADQNRVITYNELKIFANANDYDQTTKDLVMRSISIVDSDGNGHISGPELVQLSRYLEAVNSRLRNDGN